MNKFDEKYDIRFARYDEIEDVMIYINQHWKKGHILAINREFFEYEHVIDGHVTYLIARDRETNCIEGIIGYLPASNDLSKLDIWGVVWKVNDNAMPMLGIELKKRLKEYTNARTELGVGANPKTSVPLLKMLLRYKVGKMKHFYMLADKEEYKIASIKEKKIVVDICKDNVDVVQMNSIGELKEKFDFTICANDVPYKNAWYVERRYFNHPIYKYEIYGLKDKEKIKALLVIRCQECNGAKVMRIVDFIGEQKLFRGICAFCQTLLQEAEYIDMYCYGFENQYILDAGFIEKDDDDVNIIPNYFAPYECSNIDIYVDSSSDGCLFFKADGDQDRPN